MSTPSKVLFVGLGSIGQRHLGVLKKLVPDVEIFAFRNSQSSPKIEGVQDFYRWEDIPSDIDFTVVSNPTASHAEAIEECLRFQKPLFIEKPPFHSINEDIEAIIKKVEGAGILTYTAFNFRFHDLIQWAKEWVNIEEVLEATAYVGSYLPDWRKGVDYRKVYSAQAAMGGGVHLDLIHELDYLKYLFGEPTQVQALHTKVSDLEIDSADYAHYHLKYGHFFASAKLNYYRRDPKRTLELVMADKTLAFDFLKGTIYEDGNEIYQSSKTVSDTYVEQMVYFLGCIKENHKLMNSLQESTQTLKTALGHER